MIRNKTTYLEGKKQTNNDVVGCVDPPVMSPKLQPSSLGIESKGSCLTNLGKTRVQPKMPTEAHLSVFTILSSEGGRKTGKRRLRSGRINCCSDLEAPLPRPSTNTVFSKNVTKKKL